MCILLKLDDTEFGVSNLRFSKVVNEKPLGGGGLNPPFGKGRVNVILLGLPPFPRDEFPCFVRRVCSEL